MEKSGFSSPAIALKQYTCEIQPPTSQGTQHPVMLHTPRPGEGIPESLQHTTQGDSRGSLEAQGQMSVQNKGAWERCCGNRLEPCTAHLCPPYSDSVETWIPPIFIVLLLGCSYSSQYREMGETLGLDTHCNLLMTVWDTSAIPWAPWLFPALCKAQTTCMRQVIGHFSRYHPKGHGQTMGQTAALKALPFLMQLHIHFSSEHTTVPAEAAHSRGAAQQQVSAQTHSTALHKQSTGSQGTDQAS